MDQTRWKGTETGTRLVEKRDVKRMEGGGKLGWKSGSVHHLWDNNIFERFWECNIYIHIHKNFEWMMMFDESFASNKETLPKNALSFSEHKQQSNKDAYVDYKVSIIQINDEEVQDEEMVQKKTENKQKYQKMKRKLTYLCSQHQDKSLVKDNRQVSSPNKSRILTLAIEFEKNTLSQTKDYQILESKLREIYKILDHKRQHDLLILKQSRFIPAFSTLLKKVPSFHKSQFSQAVKCIELGLKLLRVFCTLSSNRDYLIFTNQLVVLNSSLSCFLSKDEKKLALECLHILHEVLCSRIKGTGHVMEADAEQIVILTIQIIFFGQPCRKLRIALENCLSEDSGFEEQFLLKGLKYLYIMMHLSSKKQLERPIYEQVELIQYMQYHSDSIILLLQNVISALVLEKETTVRDEELPICIINICLYSLKLLNLNIHINLSASQKFIETKKGSAFMVALKHIFEKAKQSVNEGENMHELASLCTETMVLMGKLCFNSALHKSNFRENGMLEALYNHPFMYIMDEKLKGILMPTLCSVMDDDKQNMCKFLEESCADGVIDYIATQSKSYQQQQESLLKSKEEESLTTTTIEEQKSIKTLTRKSSVSSLNSYTTQCTQASYKANLPLTEHKENSNRHLLHLLPYWKWTILKDELKKLDD